MKLRDIALLGGAVYLLYQWGERSALAAAKKAFEPSLPKGVRLPETGDLREVPAVQTPLDASGLVPLYNRALQIVEGGFPGEYSLLKFLRERDIVSLSFDVPDPDPEYDVAARVFAAHSALETGYGRDVWNFNTGNVTVGKGDYFLNPRVRAALKFGSYNFPLQGAVAHVDRVKRLWPDAYRAAYSGMISAYARALQAGPRVYAGDITAEALNRALSSVFLHMPRS